MFLFLLFYLVAHPVTLSEAFKTALERSEAVSEAKLRAQQSEERVWQATSGFFPRLSVVGSYLRQDAPEIATGLLSSDQSAARITLTQPLFRGFAEFATYRGSHADRSARMAEVDAAGLDLFSQVAETFYSALLVEREGQSLEEAVRLSEQRNEMVRARVRQGRARGTDQTSGQAQSAALQAKLEAARAQMVNLRLQLDSLAGIAPKDPLIADQQRELLPLESYAAQLERRPDIEALRQTALLVSEGMDIARAGHFPSLDLSGNYYLKRGGALADSKWDLGVSLTIPLFAGGLVNSQVREAALRSRESEVLFQRRRRLAREELGVLYQNLSSGLKQVRLLERAALLSKKSHDMMNHDLRFGQVTNLEVIAAQDTYIVAQGDFDRKRFEILRQFAELDARIGKIP